MKKQNQTDSAFFLGDEKRPEEYIEAAKTGVTRESFESAARKFFRERFDQSDPAQALLGQLTAAQMDGFFKIADNYLRELTGSPDAKTKRALLDDYRRCEKLIAGTEKQVNAIQARAKTFLSDGRSRTGPVARHIIDRATSLLSELFDIRHSINLQKGRLPLFLVKNLPNQYIMDLKISIGNEFPGLDSKSRDVLIAALWAAAKGYTGPELSSGDDLVGRIKMKVSRAREYQRKTFVDDPPYSDGIYTPGTVLRVRAKKQKAGAGNKERK